MFNLTQKIIFTPKKVSRKSCLADLGLLLKISKLPQAKIENTCFPAILTQTKNSSSMTKCLVTNSHFLHKNVTMFHYLAFGIVKLDYL